MRNAAKVLIVDDDKSSSQLLSEVVKRMGFKPIVTHKASDALNVVKLQTVHAALVDVLLPKMSGVDLTTEFRKTKFADNPVILVSGVFKDRNFANEAIKKSGAAEFLFKPFGVDELQESLNRVLGNLLASESWDVQGLLTRKLNSARDRAKAIEHLIPIRGPDFPFILSLLTHAGISGNLNMVNEAGEIFGVRLIKGTVSEVDSSESQATGVLALISGGYLSQDDWDEFQRSVGKRFTLEKLVSEGLVSPHAVDVAKHEQILYDFKAICTSLTLQVNFVPQEDGALPPKHAVGMKELIQLLYGSVDEFFPEDYLIPLYSLVMNAPLKLVANIEELPGVMNLEHFAALKDFRKHIEAAMPLEQILNQYPDNKKLALQGFHALVLEHCVTFEDINQKKNLQDLMDRYQKVYKELKDLTPFQIFKYFGAPAKPSDAIVKNIYDTYVHSNNPASLPKEASPQLVELSKKCFELVKNAYEVMADEQNREAIYEQQRQEEDQRERKAKELLGKGLDQLRKGQFAEAVETLRESGKEHPTNMQVLIQVWAEIKAGIGVNKPQLIETLKKIEAFPPDEKRSPYFYMAAGLVKKQMGDNSAQLYFERAFAADSSFVEARRELNALNNARESKDKRIDLLTGDITAIVSQLFRRK